MSKLSYLWPLLLLGAAGCHSGAPADAGRTGRPDVLRAALDTTVAPGDDFFAYANGTWLKSHPIPASESAWGIGQAVQEEVYANLRRLSEDAARNPAPPGSARQKIGDFWAVGLDSARADRLGVAPLQSELARLAALRTVAEVPAAMARLSALGVNVALDLNVEQDAKHSDRMAVHLWQSGLGLPDRDYYFNQDGRTRKVRREYLAHLTRTFGLLGQDAARAATSAGQVLALETALAKSSRKLEALRDPYKNYHKMSPAQLDRQAPGVGWAGWLRQAGVAGTAGADSVIVGQPEFFRQVSQLLKTTPLPAWQAYLSWQLVHAYAPTLSRAFDEENFRFYGTVLRGAKTQRPRWKRVLDMEERALGDALGQLFVGEYFKPAAKARYDTLVQNVRVAFAGRIRRLDWMSDTTQRVALTKLDKIMPKVGYPTRWKNYSTLTVDRSSLAANVMRARQWRHQYELGKLGRPVDRTEWNMTPQTYNAYYNPSNNEIVLPAAIFAVPRMLDADLDDAVVYGYAGASTIGHEITHGFDDEGSQFDARGNLREWWTRADRRRFQRRVAGIVRQFNGYKLLDSMHINGKATAGENIADLGGLVIGLDAFKRTQQYKEGKKIGGLTPVQRYFLGYALGWQLHMRDEALANQLLSDVHSPAQYRVNGPMADIPEFYEAFGVRPGQRLYRPDSARVRIW